MTGTTRTTLFLVANLGSEVSQIFSHLEKGNMELARSAESRANKIMGELLSHPDMVGRAEEVEILKEVVADAFLPKSDRRFTVSKDSMEAYFRPFTNRLMSSR